MRTPIVAVVGESGSGKTTVIEALVSCMRERGLRVATAKHVHHDIENLDVPGKDSWRHRRAGSIATLVVSRNEVALFADPGLFGRSVTRSLELLEEVAGADVVIVEGFSRFVEEVKADVVVIAARSEASLRDSLRSVGGRAVLAGVVWGGGEGIPPVSGIPVYDLKEGLRGLCERVLEAVARKRRLQKGPEDPY